MGAVGETEMHKTWHFPQGTHWKGGGSGKMMNTYKMLGQEYANEPYLQSAEWRRESALEEVEKTLKVLMCDLGIGI